MRAKFGWMVVGLIAVVGATMFFAQRRSVVALRAEFERQRAAARALDSVRSEHERLLAAQPAAGEPVRSAGDPESLRQARAEVERLRREAETPVADADKHPGPAERFVRGQAIPAAEWKNAGSATPAAALETALWAGAGGDVDTFAKMITLIDSRTQRAAQSLLDSLPETARAEYGTPERLIAFLSVKDVPLGSVVVRQSNDLPGWPMGEAHQMQITLTQADGTQKGASLVLLNRGDGNDWKLVVMESTVAKYAAQLRNADGAVAGK